MKEHQRLEIEAIKTRMDEGVDAELARVDYEPFTNRWATWCWRVHQAAPDLAHYRIVILAAKYVFEEQASEVSRPSPTWSDIGGINGFLTYRPDLDGEGSQDDSYQYQQALELDIIPAVPTARHELRELRKGADRDSDTSNKWADRASSYAILRDAWFRALGLIKHIDIFKFQDGFNEEATNQAK